jgi:hypothetical protein
MRTSFLGILCPVRIYLMLQPTKEELAFMEITNRRNGDISYKIIMT